MAYKYKHCRAHAQLSDLIKPRCRQYKHCPDDAEHETFFIRLLHFLAESLNDSCKTLLLA